MEKIDETSVIIFSLFPDWKSESVESTILWISYILSHTMMHSEMKFLSNTVQLLSEYKFSSVKFLYFHKLFVKIWLFNRRSKILSKIGRATQTKERNYLLNIYEQKWSLKFSRAKLIRIRRNWNSLCNVASRTAASASTLEIVNPKLSSPTRDSNCECCTLN